MDQQRYRAKWVDQEGRQRELLFESSENLSIARVDFKLKLIGRNIPRPDVYELEEISRGPLVQTGGH